MGLFYNSKSSGSGIDKNAPEKSRIVIYFEVLLRKFWKIIEANMLYFVFFIPLFMSFYAFYFVTNAVLKILMIAVCSIVFVLVFGPATAGIFKIMRNFSLEKHAFILSDFKKAFTENYKKAFFTGLMDIIAVVSACSAVYVYPGIIESSDSKFIYVPLVLTLSIAIAIIIMSFYAYLMIIGTDLSFKNILKNSFILSYMAGKKSVASFLITALLVTAFIVLTIFNLYTVLAYPFVPAGFIVYTIAFICYPVIQKYVINPYYEQKGEVNPELKQYDEDDEEAVFTDRGGHEQPIKPDKKKRKTIS